MKTLMLIMRILTVLPAIIKAVQQMVPEDAGHGPTKLKAALDMLATTVGDISAVLPMVTAMIETLVGIGKGQGALVSASPTAADDQIFLH